MDQYFAFSSASAGHFQGVGDWKIRADQGGVLTIEHHLLGGVTNYGPFRLTAGEASAFWKLVGAAGLEKRPANAGRGSPDEAVLAFMLFGGEGLHSVQLWASEALSDAAIQQLVMEIGNLIEKYTGRKPLLR
jgi:hypothetical protein